MCKKEEKKQKKRHAYTATNYCTNKRIKDSKVLYAVFPHQSQRQPGKKKRQTENDRKEQYMEREKSKVTVYKNLISRCKK